MVAPESAYEILQRRLQNRALPAGTGPAGSGQGVQPEVGSILVFRRSGRLPDGHVAVVSQVLSRRQSFRPYLERHAVDIIQPDCTKCGGITEAWRIAWAARRPDAERSQISVNRACHCRGPSRERKGSSRGKSGFAERAGISHCISITRLPFRLDNSRPSSWGFAQCGITPARGSAFVPTLHRYWILALSSLDLRNLRRGADVSQPSPPVSRV